MKVKTKRLETIKMLISSMELSSQEEVIKALQKEGYKLTQATLSRDLKQLKVAKAASMGENMYMYFQTIRCINVFLHQEKCQKCFFEVDICLYTFQDKWLLLRHDLATLVPLPTI